MYINDTDRFNGIIKYFTDPFNSILRSLNDVIKIKACEVRMRINRPLGITMPEKTVFIGNDSKIYDSIQPHLPVTKKEDIEQTFRKLCGYSVHTHKNEISAGFISLVSGNRAGICATAVYENGQISSAKNITSINLRIARQSIGSADGLVDYFNKKTNGMLIVGSPGSGKTTLLRDLARQLSLGKNGTLLKTVIIDTRGEIAAINEGIPQNDIGLCDVLNGFETDKGISMATRFLSPDVIICDEIGTLHEAQAIENTLNAGVAVIASVHAGSFSEFKNRPYAINLLQSGAFKWVVFLCGAHNPTTISRIYESSDLLSEDHRNFTYGNLNSVYRDDDIFSNEKPLFTASFDH